MLNVDRKVTGELNLERIWKERSCFIIIIFIIPRPPPSQWWFGPFSGHCLPVAGVSRQLSFYDVRNSAPPLCPNLKGQRISASRALPTKNFRRRWPYQDLVKKMPLRKDGATEGVGYTVIGFKPSISRMWIRSAGSCSWRPISSCRNELKPL